MSFIQRMTGDDMKKTFALPLVPGTTCGEELLRRNYHRNQVFGAKAEKAVRSERVPIDYSSTLGSVGGISRSINGANAPLYPTQKQQIAALKGGPVPESGSMIAYQQSANAPADLERHVLRFYGFFRESVQESKVERERIRKVAINLFLEDGTISVSEPRQDNSGIPQGTMIKRHLIPTPNGDGVITFNMLSVGSTVSFYGRTYYLVDCDDFTRQFMASVGIECGEAIPYPDDAHTLLRSRPAKVNDVPSLASITSTNIKLSSNQVRAAKQFFDKDGDVLRCDVIWDDGHMLYGGVHRLRMYYFLADDTIEVVERATPNDGKDPFPSFIRRQKMYKPKGDKFESMTSSLTFKGKDESNDFYKDSDIYIGAMLSLFGRDMLVIDYDQHTRDHLRLKYGITEYLPMTEQFKVRPKPKIIPQPPPHNGFGTEEDSLNSWNKLDVKPVRKDDKKFLKYGGSVVKFSAKLICTGMSPDEDRRFVLSAYMCDDTIAIFEPVQRNSGIVGGKFLQRQSVKNPATGKNYVASDFHVGSKPVINGFRFLILATDERSMSYMEQNSAEFPQCNVNTIAHKLQAMLTSSQTGLAEAFYRADSDGKGIVDYKQFVAISEGLGLDLSEQEILTLLRYFDRNGDSYLSYEEFVSRMMPEGSVIGQDSRDWKDIYQASVNEENDKLSIMEKVAFQKKKVETTTAAYGARAFMEAYNNRRTLFHQEFKFICDYSTDEKISEKEFRICVQKKLKLDLTEAQVDALCSTIFPPGARRMTYDEFIRLINSNSNRDYNLKQVRDRRL
eukprot:Tbor_TRINITY_DN4122_c0_g1::TRINITY_DN4122_c0_g1_i1::g.26520::m.26520